MTDERFKGVCIVCTRYVEDGHGRTGAMTLCPECCIRRKGRCASCAQVIRDRVPLSPERQAVLDEKARRSQALHRSLHTKARAGI